MSEKFYMPELKRHSASQLNRFIESRPQWYIERIVGDNKYSDNINTARGKAVEDGINYYIWGVQDTQDSNGQPIGSRDYQECIKHALEQWDNYTKDVDHVNKLEFKQSIGPLLTESIDSFRNVYDCRKLVTQAEYTVFLPGVEKPVLCKLDYLYEGKKVIDNKVSAKTPSGTPPKLKQSYVLQGALYRHATGLPVEFHYGIPLKTGPKCLIIKLSDAQYEYGLKLAIEAAKAIETIFDNIQNINGDLMRSLMFMNPEAYYNEDERQKARGHFGLL